MNTEQEQNASKKAIEKAIEQENKNKYNSITQSVKPENQNQEHNVKKEGVDRKNCK